VQKVRDEMLGAAGAGAASSTLLKRLSEYEPEHNIVHLEEDEMYDDNGAANEDGTAVAENQEKQ
jgi:hypothetical protein